MNEMNLALKINEWLKNSRSVKEWWNMCMAKCDDAVIKATVKMMFVNDYALATYLSDSRNVTKNPALYMAVMDRLGYRLLGLLNLWATKIHKITWVRAWKDDWRPVTAGESDYMKWLVHRWNTCNDGRPSYAIVDDVTFDMSEDDICEVFSGRHVFFAHKDQAHIKVDKLPALDHDIDFVMPVFGSYEELAMVLMLDGIDVDELLGK